MKLRRVGIDTRKENAAYLQRDCHACRSEDPGGLSKIDVRSEDGGNAILATRNAIDDATIAAPVSSASVTRRSSGSVWPQIPRYR